MTVDRSHRTARDSAFLKALRHTGLVEKQDASQKFRKKRSQVPYRQLAGIGMSLVTEFCVACLLGWFIGQKLDERFQTSPWLMLSFTVVFLILATFRLILQLKRFNDR